MVMQTDYYETLQLQRDADGIEIKKAYAPVSVPCAETPFSHVFFRRYRRLALTYHPDKDGSDDAKKAFARIAEAFDVLSSSALSSLATRRSRPGYGLTAGLH